MLTTRGLHWAPIPVAGCSQWLTVRAGWKKFLESGYGYWLWPWLHNFIETFNVYDNFQQFIFNSSS